jgi:hypothetical protein
MRVVGAFVVCASAFTACASTPHGEHTTPRADAGALARFAWLTGVWQDVAADGTLSEETWLAPAGHSMIGAGRVVANGRTVFFEYLAIREDDAGNVVYEARPNGHEPVAFRFVGETADGAVFTNPEHDDPQRIVYRHADGDRLEARTEGVDHGQRHVETFRFFRAR